MRKTTHTLATALFLIICSFCDAQYHDSAFVDGKVLFKVRDTFPTVLDLTSPYLQPLVALYQMDTCYRPFLGLGSDSLDRTYCIRFSDTAKTQWCIDTLRSLGIIDYVEQIPLRRTDFTPNDFDVANQWNLIKINAQQAWDISQGSTSVIIAIVDNGVRTTHEDLAPNLWVNSGEVANNILDDDLNGYGDDVNGYDVADNDGNPNPPTGVSTTDFWNHGTHCAGIASAATNNNKGIASIGFKAKIMAIKCTSNSGSANELTNTMDGINYAIRNHANIISMSFGSEDNSITEQVLMNTAHSQGIILVAAAGNAGAATPYYPASYNFVISVGATDQADMKASYSNYGSTVDLMAPGNSIYSTLASGNNTDYGSFSGTSSATPLVAGLASLAKAQHPGFTPDQIETQMKNGADDISALNPGFPNQLGAGRINAFKTLGGVVSIIDDDETSSLLNAYPNPFADKIFLKRSNTEDEMLIECMDMEGKICAETILASGKAETEIQTQDLTAGVYLLKLSSSQKIVCRKIVKMNH